MGTHLDDGLGEDVNLSERNDVIPGGTHYCGIDMDYKGYKIMAFPGPDVVLSGRTEHLPLHCHVWYGDNQELRIDCETFKELDGKKIPRDLRKYLSRNIKEIGRRVEEVFLVGIFSR